MINNSSINFTSNKYVQTKAPQEIEPEEDNSFEGTARRMKKDDAKVRRDLLLGSLIALSTIAAPVIYTSLDDAEPTFEPSGIVVTEHDQNILDKAHEYAKFGKDSTLLEPFEFEGLLDYSALDRVPYSIGESIKISAKSGFAPVDTRYGRGDEKILQQVQNAQALIDEAVKRYLGE